MPHRETPEKSAVEPGELVVRPIGVIRTPYTDRYRAPRQPGAAHVPAEGIIELDAGENFEQALEDLAGFERIWVIYWFHRNSTWKPKVLPPRGERRKRGLFATRSPHRPNPIGLSLLRLLEVRGRIIRVADVDLLDGTPILDIKPYLPYAEAFPDAAAGWLDEVIAMENGAGNPAENGAENAGIPPGEFHTVEWSPLATEQASWLAEHHDIDLAGIAEPLLRRDPTPHPYRRISRRDDGGGDGGLQLAIKSWRLLFRTDEGKVSIERVKSGYDAERMAAASPGALHDHEAHEGFHLRWPEIP